MSERDGSCYIVWTLRDSVAAFSDMTPIRAWNVYDWAHGRKGPVWDKDTFHVRGMWNHHSPLASHRDAGCTHCMDYLCTVMCRKSSNWLSRKLVYMSCSSMWSCTLINVVLEQTEEMSRSTTTMCLGVVLWILIDWYWYRDPFIWCLMTFNEKCLPNIAIKKRVALLNLKWGETKGTTKAYTYLHLLNLQNKKLYRVYKPSYR